MAGLTHVPSPLRDRSNYNDFVRTEGEHQPTHRSSRSKKSSRSSKKSSKKKSSSTTSKKKKEFEQFDRRKLRFRRITWLHQSSHRRRCGQLRGCFRRRDNGGCTHGTGGHGVSLARSRNFFRFPAAALCLPAKVIMPATRSWPRGYSRRLGWKVETRLTFPPSELSALTRSKTPGTGKIAGEAGRRIDGHPRWVAWARFASAFARSDQGRLPDHQFVRPKGAYVFAVDFPSGLDGDSGATDRDCVVADFTVTIGAAKCGLLADSALDHVGRLEVVLLKALRARRGD